jgi:hypothetical protein
VFAAVDRESDVEVLVRIFRHGFSRATFHAMIA